MALTQKAQSLGLRDSGDAAHYLVGYYQAATKLSVRSLRAALESVRELAPCIDAEGSISDNKALNSAQSRLKDVIEYLERAEIEQQSLFEEVQGE